MNDIASRVNRPVSNRLHRRVYAAMIGLALVLALSVWGFAGPGYADFVLVVVTAFVLGAVGLQYFLWRVAGRRRNAGPAPGDRKPFRDWADSEFDTGQGRLEGRSAAVEILLPLAAVAFGMVAFAIVLHFAAPGGV